MNELTREVRENLDKKSIRLTIRTRKEISPGDTIRHRGGTVLVRKVVDTAEGKTVIAVSPGTLDEVARTLENT